MLLLIPFIYAADMVAKDIMFHKMYEITFMKDVPRQNSYQNDTVLCKESLVI